MTNKRNFLVLAIGVGVFGVVVGAITILSIASTVLEP